MFVGARGRHSFWMEVDKKSKENRSIVSSSLTIEQKCALHWIFQHAKSQSGVIGQLLYVRISKE